MNVYLLSLWHLWVFSFCWLHIVWFSLRHFVIGVLSRDGAMATWRHCITMVLVYKPFIVSAVILYYPCQHCFITLMAWCQPCHHVNRACYVYESQCNSSVEFPEILSHQNHLRYDWQNVSRISKIIHCEILINTLYSVVIDFHHLTSWVHSDKKAFILYSW